MISCTRCGYKNLEGSIVCDRCASFLGADLPTPIANRKATTSGLYARVPYRLQSLGSELRLVLKPQLFYQLRSSFLEGRLILGRADSDSDSTMLSVQVPNAIELGVSRHHAALVPTPEGIGVHDLESTNGTFLNRARLIGTQLYRLEQDDEIQLGQLILHVILE